MGKHGGLTGNSGLLVDGDGKVVGHISAPYDNNGMVFVEVQHPEYGMIWERMPKEQAEAEGKTIIRCCQCDKPATSLDHFYPYFSGQNLCDDHEYDPGLDE